MSSVYQGWKGLVLEGRVDSLEAELEVLKQQEAVRSYEPQEVLIERLRRQIEERFHRRVSREARRDFSDSYDRTTRDAPECVCPPG